MHCGFLVLTCLFYFSLSLFLNAPCLSPPPQPHGLRCWRNQRRPPLLLSPPCIYFPPSLFLPLFLSLCLCLCLYFSLSGLSMQVGKCPLKQNTFLFVTLLVCNYRGPVSIQACISESHHCSRCLRHCLCHRLRTRLRLRRPVMSVTVPGYLCQRLAWACGPACAC